MQHIEASSLAMKLLGCHLQTSLRHMGCNVNAKHNSKSRTWQHAGPCLGAL